MRNSLYVSHASNNNYIQIESSLHEISETRFLLRITAAHSSQGVNILIHMQLHKGINLSNNFKTSAKRCSDELSLTHLLGILSERPLSQNRRERHEVDPPYVILCDMDGCK